MVKAKTKREKACFCNFHLVFLIGMLFGVGMSLLMVSPYMASRILESPLDGKMSKVGKTIKLVLDKKFVKSRASSNLILARSLEDETHFMKGKELAKRMRILCWVMTANSTQNKEKALTIKRTWGRRCDKLLFFSDHEDPDVPVIKIDNVQPGRFGLWTKVVGAFKYIYKYHRDDYDWVLRADDDTAAIIENMREMLLPYDHRKPGFFGYRYRPLSPKGYFSGGGGMLLSKFAVDRVVTGAFDGKHKDCINVTYSAGDDDVKIAKCLYAVGVETDDSRDYLGRSRMHCFSLESHLNPDLGPRNWWFWEYLYWPIKGGLACCADNGLAWHYIPPATQYMVQFLAYNVRVENVINSAKATVPPQGIPVTTPTTTHKPANMHIVMTRLPNGKR